MNKKITERQAPNELFFIFSFSEIKLATKPPKPLSGSQKLWSTLIEKNKAPKNQKDNKKKKRIYYEYFFLKEIHSLCCLLSMLLKR